MSEDYINTESSSGRGLVDIVGFDVAGIDSPEMYNLTIKEIVLGESLLTPGLQSSVTLQSAIYLPIGKNFDKFKNRSLQFSLRFNDYNDTTRPPLTVSQQIYRLDNRSFMPLNVGQTEEFTIHACDSTLLENERKLVSRSWSCTRPSEVVKTVLQCVGADNLDIESAEQARDYIAENIHPFQVVAQQSNVAWVNGKNGKPDPSFVHYMTYKGYDGSGMPTHHFRSLKSLTDVAPDDSLTFWQSETGLTGDGNYGNRNAVINFMFPCDFDYLSDLMNGIDENGNNMNSLAVFNEKNKSMSLLGNQQGGDCRGIGAYNFKVAMTNKGTEKQQQSCNLDVENHVLLRQARMALLEKDKVALRLTVPWNSNLAAGKVIRLMWQNKYDTTTSVYGSGEYLIVSLMHTVKLGGFSTTTMDCVSRTVGIGEV